MSGNKAIRARWAVALLAHCVVTGWFGTAFAQGVTTSSVTGVVTDPQKQAVPGAVVLAVHEPSGTEYQVVTRADGQFMIPGMRVGGPYTITASLEGFKPATVKSVNLSLGVTQDVKLELAMPTMTEELVITAQSDPVFSSARTGAATAVNREALATLPTQSDRIDSFVRLTPQAGGNGTFAGQDNRLNNFTVDGSYFNNSFGLSGQPGDRTGVAPIAMAAIEEVQVNVAPYDVRQGNFVGAGINSVTRSGGNQLRGSVYYWFRNEGMGGSKAKEATVNKGTFDFKKFGGWVSGPIIKNKLFFFLSAEDDTDERPGTTFRANQGTETVGGSTTRVLASDLDALGSYLQKNFDYATGPYQGYSHETPATRYLAKLDYSINARNKVVIRYNQLDSKTDVLLSNSSSLGFGNRRTLTTGLNFQNSNYQIIENIRSVIGEWNSVLGARSSNTLIAGYTYQDESRDSRGSFFPMVDILKDNSVYTTFGFEPFTPNNELRYKTFQFQDNFTTSFTKHTVTAGASVERYTSENVFFPGSQGIYVYNSLAEFYTDANDYLANPSRSKSPVTLNKFQVRWNNIPGMEKPVQPLGVWYTGLYAQDVWQVTPAVRITAGLRMDVPMFDDTGYTNAAADALTFRDETGASVQYESGKLPDANILWSPRVGFNWDATGDRSTQVRGGTGVFTGRPAYVWISNQVGNTGVLTGFDQQEKTTARPFNPNPDAYKPATVTGAPASSYELAVTQADFKFPQVWRSNLAVDRRLPYGIIGTAEYVYNRDVNGIYYINANLPVPSGNFAGADARPRWAKGNKLNSTVVNNIVLKNQDVGRSWNLAFSLQKSFREGFLKAAYSYGEAKNTVDPGSIASGSFTGNAHAGDPNNPGLAFSGNSPGHRVFIAGSYRKEYKNFGATTLSFFWQGAPATTPFTGTNNQSYTFSGDLNGDGGSANDLIYIARDTSEMNFQTYTSGSKTYTAAEQAVAWDAFIAQDKYLSKHRGEYAQRGTIILPMVFRTDVTLAQDLFRNIGGKRNLLQIRVDVLNFANLLNSDWGVSQRLVTATPLLVPSGAPADASGKAQYRLRAVNDKLISQSFEYASDISDTYRAQFSIKFMFN